MSEGASLRGDGPLASKERTERAMSARAKSVMA